MMDVTTEMTHTCKMHQQQLTRCDPLPLSPYAGPTPRQVYGALPNWVFNTVMHARPDVTDVSVLNTATVGRL
jgi:hypothetical protein